MLSFALAVLAVSIWAVVVGKKCAWLCAAVVAINFLLNETFVRVTGLYTAWYWFTLTDTLAVLVLTRPQAGYLGGIMAASYLTQIIMHWGYVITPDADPYAYWQGLTAMAWLQLLILFSGAACDRGGPVFDRLCALVGRAPAARAGGAGEARREEEQAP
jgi:hypothetical protein